MGTAFQRRSALGIADQPELPPYSSPGPSIAMAAKPQGRRPGLFGRLGNALARVDWERVAAAMRDDPSHMQMLMQQRENAAERMRQEAEAEAERRTMKGRNEQLRGFIDTLPEDQRSAAWVAPQAYVEAQAPMTQYQRENLDLEREQLDIARERARRGDGGGIDAGAYRVLTAQEVQQRGLPPGSYQLNTRTNQVTPIGRVRGQYTEFAGTSAAYANRMEAADRTLRELETTVGPAGVFMGQVIGGNTEERRVRQAQREFINAILRRESGAVIADSEFNSARQQYFPVPGDPPEVVEQKRQARQRAIDGLINQSQGAYDEWYPGQQPEADDVGMTLPTPSGANRRQRGPIGGNTVRWGRDAQGRPVRLP